MCNEDSIELINYCWLVSQ